MKGLLHTILWTILLLISHQLQSNDVIRWQRFTTADGLSHRTISSIEEDSLGGIWMATWNGICHYDGENFTTYNNTNDGQKLGRLLFVRPLPDGKIWCLSQNDKTPFLYDPTNRRISSTSDTRIVRKGMRPYEIDIDSSGLHITHKEQIFHIPFSPGNSYRIDTHIFGLTDKDGTLWVNFDDALYRISFSPSPFQHIRHISEARQKTFSNEFRSILMTSDSSNWWASKDGLLLRYDNNNQFIGSLDTNGIFQLIPTHFDAKFYTMYADKDTLWIGSKGNGLYRLIPNGKNYTITHLPTLRSDSLYTQDIYDLLLVGDNQLWVATWGKGLWAMSLFNEDLKVFNITIPNSKIRSLTPYHNLIAAATTQGLYLFDQQQRLKTQIGDLDVSCIHENSDGNTYIGTMGKGLLRLITNEEGEYILEPYELTGINNLIFNIIETPDKQTWFICDNILIRRLPNGSIQKFDNHFFGETINFSEGKPVFANNKLWIGTANGQFYIRTDLPHSQATIYTPQPVLPQKSLWMIFIIAITVSVSVILFVTKRIKQKKTKADLTISKDETHPNRLSAADKKFYDEVSTYIKEHCDNSQISINDIAESMGINRTYFYKQFKHVFNSTPASVILDIRISHAIQLIKEGKHELADIAYQTGFNDSKYFYRVFKQKIGITPKQFAIQERQKRQS